MMPAGVLLNQFDCQSLLNVENFRSLTEPGHQSGARFLDLGGERPQIRTYLPQLQRSFLFAMSTGFISMAVVLLVFMDFNLSWYGGTSLFHPIADFLFGLTALSLAIVSALSCITSIKYLKQTVREICKS